jgi:LysM repeat protein
VYSGAITVSATETLEAIAVETGYTNSPVATAAYTIAPVLPAPTFSPAAGSYAASQSVTIGDSTAGATIYYTTNGSTPTTSSSVYTGAITVSATEMLEAIAVETGYTNSSLATAAYTIAATLPAPTFSPAAGSYAASQSVTIGDSTAGATIYYTTNGTMPTTSSAVYSGPINLSATETLEAIAVETGYTNSPVASAAYTIAATLPAPAFAPAPAFSPAPGTYTSPQSVTISDAQAGATIYYTTNGTTPTTSSAVYSGPITVSATETLEAMAAATGYTNSEVVTASYTIPAAFTISLGSTALSLVAGQSSTTTATINPVNGFNQVVSFGCNGLPAGLSCAFSPSSVATSGVPVMATLTIAANMNMAASRGTEPLVPAIAAAFLFCAIGFRSRRRFYPLLFIAGFVLLPTALNGCGGFAGTMPSPVTSIVTVTATAGTIQQSAALTVTVN